jgi:AraC family transcriptional activator of pobA
MYNANLNFYFKRVDNESFQIPFHSHKCYELVYYNTGSGHCLIDGTSFSYEKNEFVLIPPDCTHNDIHGDKCKLICIGFTLSSKEDFLAKGTYRDENKNVSTYLKIISQEFKDKQEDYISTINCCIENIITEIKRKQSFPQSRTSTHQATLDQTINYINEYFLSDISGEQLAIIANYSYHHFRHIFKTALGVSPKQYIISKRIEYAKKLIATTPLSITEIGYQCGFPSTSLFIKQFKNNTGITPIKYRKQLKSDCVFSSEQSDYNNK